MARRARVGGGLWDGMGGVGVLSRRLAHGVCTASRIMHATIVCERLNTDIPRVRAGCLNDPLGARGAGAGSAGGWVAGRRGRGEGITLAQRAGLV